MISNSYNIYSGNPENHYFFSNSTYIWPTPGFHTITSFFGNRTSPVNGASSNHSGIDIAAPTGTNIYSIISRKCNIHRF